MADNTKHVLMFLIMVLGVLILNYLSVARDEICSRTGGAFRWSWESGGYCEMRKSIAPQ
jgi:hypothetical protein